MLMMMPLALTLLSSCGSSEKQQQQAAPTAVGYVVVKASSVPVETDIPGRISPYSVSQVRPQVSGVIQRRLFKEGSVVHAGQPLYRIDPSLYQASVNQAQANLQSAVAASAAAQAKADRYKPLAKIQAVSQQDYTDAVAAANQAKAAVAQARAALQTARINLRFTTVPAPITGKISRSYSTVGALVTANQSDALATIQQLDPVYVDMQESADALLKLRQSLDKNGVMPATASVQLKLPDGSDYGMTGRVEFTESIVDQSTGTVTLRARFPNPQGMLLPGMFVTGRFAQSVDTDAILVPQQAVTHDPKGNATLFVVGPNNKAILKTITTSRAVGSNWVVTGGIKPGDKVITQGTGKIRDGAPIKAVPQNASQTPPQPSGKNGEGAGAEG